MKRLLLTLAFLSFAAFASAQTQATPTSRLEWDQTNVATAADAAALNYKYYADAVTTGNPLVGVTCAGVPPALITCSTLIPAFTPAVQHTVKITASNIAGESLPSNTLAFQLIVVPSAPSNLRFR